MFMTRICIFLMLLFCRLSAYEFALITVPKSGSHLLGCALELITGKSKKVFYPPKRIYTYESGLERYTLLQKNHQYELSHIPYFQTEADIREALGCKVFCVLRDPRDVIISYVNYIDKGFAISEKERVTWNRLKKPEKITYLDFAKKNE